MFVPAFHQYFRVIFFQEKNVFPERKFYHPARLHQWLLNIKVQTISYKYVDLGQFPSHYDLKLEMGQSLSIQYHDH